MSGVEKALEEIATAVKEIAVALRVQGAAKRGDGAVDEMQRLSQTFLSLMSGAPEPPSWFHPEGVGQKPEPPPDPRGVNAQVMMAVKSKGLFNDLDRLLEFVGQSQRTDDETRNRLARWCGEVQAYHEAFSEWELAHQKARLGQWPACYADLVMRGTASRVNRSGTG